MVNRVQEKDSSIQNDRILGDLIGSKIHFQKRDSKAVSFFYFNFQKGIFEISGLDFYFHAIVQFVCFRWNLKFFILHYFDWDVAC